MFNVNCSFNGLWHLGNVTDHNELKMGQPWYVSLHLDNALFSVAIETLDWAEVLKYVYAS